MDAEILSHLIHARCASSQEGGNIPIKAFETLVKDSFKKFADKLAENQNHHETDLADRINAHGDEEEIQKMTSFQEPLMKNFLNAEAKYYEKYPKSFRDGSGVLDLFENADEETSLSREEFENKLASNSELKSLVENLICEIVLPVEVLNALNFVREDPRKCAAELKTERLPRYMKDKTYQVPADKSGVGKARNIVTKEGAHACQDAINYCSTLPQTNAETTRTGDNIPKLLLNPIITLVSEDHADDIGRNGVVSHAGSDGETGLWDRMTRYVTSENMATGECLWYGHPSFGKDMIYDLIVDDGVPTRGHRLGCFDKRYTEIGISIKPHKTFGHVLAMDFANRYNWYEGDEELRADCSTRISNRLENGPVILATKLNSKGKADESTQWSKKGSNSTMNKKSAIGTCGGCGEEIKGGSVIEAQGAKYHAGCFRCSQTSCKKKLSGVPYLIENRKLFCKSCHTDLFGLKCAGCGEKIAGKMLTAIDKQTWHPECFKCVDCGVNCASQTKKVKWVVCAEVDSKKPMCGGCLDKRNNNNDTSNPSSSSKLGNIPGAGTNGKSTVTPRKSPRGMPGAAVLPKGKAKAKAKVSMGGAQKKVAGLGMDYSMF